MTGEPRIPLLSEDSDLSLDQRRVLAEILSGPRAGIAGPLRVVLHRPDLADPWQRLGAVLRFDTSLSPHLVELAVLVTARRWSAHVEWAVHEPAARAAGLSEHVISDIGAGRPPDFDDAEQADVYTFVVGLQQHGDVPDDLYRRLRDRWGAVAMVELSSVVGYYTMVAMTLNVHRVSQPHGTRLPAPHAGLVHLPPARRASAGGNSG